MQISGPTDASNTCFWAQAVKMGGPSELSVYFGQDMTSPVLLFAGSLKFPTNNIILQMTIVIPQCCKSNIIFTSLMDVAKIKKKKINKTLKMEFSQSGRLIKF